MTWKQFALASTCICLAGCAPVLGSRSTGALGAADRTAGRADGEVYFLPKALIWAHVKVNPATGISVVLDEPVIVPSDVTPSADTALDTAATGACQPVAGGAPVSGPFVLNYNVTGFHKDAVTVEVEHSLLKTANGKSEEQVSLILTELAKAAGAFGFESDVSSAEFETFATSFDPADCDSVLRATSQIQRAIRAAAAKWPAAAKVDSRFDPGSFAITVDGYSPFRFPTAARPTAADCGKGVCVPVLRPATVAVTNGGVVRRSAVIYLPNGSDPAVIPIARSPFANVDTQLTLTEGVLTKRVVTRDSEVLTIATIPATVVGAYLDAVAGTFTKRKTAFDNEKAFRDAVDAAAKAKADTETKQEAIVDRSGVRSRGLRLPIVGASRPPPPPLVQQVVPQNNGSQPQATESNDGHK